MSLSKILQEHFTKSKYKIKPGEHSWERIKVMTWQKMRFQTTLEGAECLRHSDAGRQSVPDAQCSDRRRTRGHQSSYDRWSDKGRNRCCRKERVTDYTSYYLWHLAISDFITGRVDPRVGTVPLTKNCIFAVENFRTNHIS